MTKVLTSPWLAPAVLTAVLASFLLLSRCFYS